MLPLSMHHLRNRYVGVDGFIKDVRLVWHNACIYNPVDQWVHKAALNLEKDFENRLSSLIGVDPPASVPAGQSGVPLIRTPSVDMGGSTVPLARVKAIVKSLQTNQASIVFRKPVDPVAMGIPHYVDTIKRPMDLQTISERLDQVGHRTAALRSAHRRTHTMLFFPPTPAATPSRAGIPRCLNSVSRLN